MNFALPPPPPKKKHRVYLESVQTVRIYLKHRVRGATNKVRKMPLNPLVGDCQETFFGLTSISITYSLCLSHLHALFLLCYRGGGAPLSSILAILSHAPFPPTQPRQPILTKLSSPCSILLRTGRKPNITFSSYPPFCRPDSTKQIFLIPFMCHILKL